MPQGLRVLVIGNTICLSAAEEGDPGEEWRRRQAAGRRRSRVQKQHSYDDEIKAGAAAGGPADVGLGECSRSC